MRPRVLLIWVILGFVLGGACLLSMLHFTGGAFSMPLDDSYIFFQYAKRLVEGAPFSYQEGDPPTTGLTSWLTMLVHAVGYAVGFRGAWMSVYALMVGWGALVWACVSLVRLGERLHPQVSWAGAALLLATGPFVWGAYSGMDFPLFMALSLAWAAAWPNPGRRPGRNFFILGGLLGLARPDAVFMVGLGFLLALRNRGFHWGWLLPLVLTAVPFISQWALTGSAQSASMDVKSVLSEPRFTVTQWLTEAVGHWTYVIKGVFLGSALGDPDIMHANNKGAAPLYWFPLALVFFLIGFAPRIWQEVRERSHGPASLLFGSAILLLVAQCLTVPTHWHWNRYLMGVSLLALPGIAWGLVRLGAPLEGIARELRGGEGAKLAVVLAVLLSSPSVVYFVLAYGKNSSDIYHQHIQLAETINAGNGVGEQTVVGVHDVGALAYFGNYRVLDLEGLASREFQKASRNQAAGVWEALEHLAPRQLPRYLAVYSNWFVGDWLRPHRMIMSQRQFDSSIAAGNPLLVYEANWDLLRTGDLPQEGVVPQACRLLGEVDVSDVLSEREANYRHSILGHAYQDLLPFLPDFGDGVIADGGRLVSGGEMFTIPAAATGQVRLVTRSHTPFRLRVRLNGRDLGVWNSGPQEGQGWQERSFTCSVPEGRADALTFELHSDDPYHSAYGSFHYWVYQCP